MIDIYEIVFCIQVQCRTYAIQGAWAAMWNFRFMDNLYNFGKDFR